MLYQFIFDWQQLIGAFIGAITPLSLWFFYQWEQKRRKHKKDLYYLEKTLVYNINNVIDARTTIRIFIDKLDQLIKNIDSNDDLQYSVDTAFFPLFHASPIDENLLKISSGSGYLDNRIVQLLRMGKDYALAINDARNQFRETIKMNKEMAFYKLNAPGPQKKLYKQNINDFIEAIEKDFFKKNTKIYLKKLVSTRVVLNEIRNKGIMKWRFKFEPHFKYFENQSDLKIFKNETFNRIDQSIKEKTEIELVKLDKK